MVDIQSLPVEILCKIMTLIDRSALYNCALSARVFLPPARDSLYRNISLELDPVPEASDLLSRTLLADPALGALVTTLELSSTRHEEYPFLISIAEPVPLLRAGLLPFPLLTGLRTLTLRCFAMYACRAHDLLAILGMLPQLVRLECSSFPHWAYDARMCPAPLRLGPPGSTREPMAHQPLPRIQELVLHNVTSAHAELVRGFMASAQDALGRLSTLDISRHEFFALAWLPVIHAAASSLHFLGLPIPDYDSEHPQRDTLFVTRSTIERYGTYTLKCNATCSAASSTTNHVRGLARAGNLHSYVLHNIPDCGALRHLRLEHCPDQVFRALHPAHLLLGICELFERRPVPFPALNHLELWLVDRTRLVEPVPTDVISRLADVLLDRTKYPRFRAITVRVQLQIWVEYFDARVVQAEGEDLARQVSARWRALFGAFDDVPGVVLDVRFQTLPEGWW
ncbi:hypothetical protein BD413DRAFT_310533 [Trametes elegans]|nr:hypothetical protein BD413DRAFT_310533 [Trametes elegans]